MMRSRALVAALTAAAASMAAQAVALDPNRALTQYVQNVWRVEQGLPHNTVRAVVQARDGYLWLGTYAGLARFDGVRFKVFDTGNSALTNNEIRVVHEDARGVLWVGTTAGGLYRVENGELRAETAPIENKTINAIISTADGALLVGTGHGLYRLFGGRTERFTTDQGLQANLITALAEGSGGRVLIGMERGVDVLQNGVISRGPEVSGSRQKVQSLLVDKEGGLLIGGDRLDRYDASGRRTLSLPVPFDGIHALFQDNDGVIWVGTYGSGIARLENGALNMYRQQDGFLDRRAWAIAPDREGGLWIGTRGGLAQLRDGAATSFSSAEGFAGDIGRSVLEDRDGALYFGFDGGVSRFVNGRVTNLDLGPRLRGSTVRGLMRDRRGVLWIGTDQGLAEEVGDGRFRVYGEKEGLPAGGRFTVEDRQGRLWISSGAGLWLKEGERFHMPKFLHPLANSEIQALLVDRTGALWIGTLNHGAWRLVGDQLEQVPLGGLTSIGVRSFLHDEDGAFYVGTIGSGLFIRHGERDFRAVTTREGLLDDSIWSILDDGRGRFWLLSDRGVFRVAKQDLLEFADGRLPRVRPNAVVDTTNGLKSRECNGGGGPAGFLTRDGRVLAPTGAGVAIIEPRLLISNAPPPPVQVEEVVVDRNTVSWSGDAVVPAGGRDTEIHFTGLSFLNPAQIRFRYRLEGHDAFWVDAGSRRAAYYGGLAPGTYTFRVAGSNDGINWSTQESAITLTVRPIWYQNWIFRLSAASLALGLLGAGFAWRVRLLEGRARELESVVAARTEELAERSRELEAANASLGRLAVTDDLTGIANHRLFREFLDREWARCARTREPISLLMCDIDDFKAYNDALGHQGGDECLRLVAQTLDAVVKRAPDLAARYGGEEFVVVLPATGLDGAISVADALRLALRERALPHPRSRVGPIVTMSIGGATLIPSTDSSVEDLIARADGALYAAKRAGRDRAVVG
ncbi:MAG: diguanylate cyclase [Vicinamibacteria bacterium]|nr:diguanylate cyclase [Vicinamibacteria bacterium]